MFLYTTRSIYYIVFLLSLQQYDVILFFFRASSSNRPYKRSRCDIIEYTVCGVRRYAKKKKNKQNRPCAVCNVCVYMCVTERGATGMLYKRIWATDRHIETECEGETLRERGEESMCRNDLELCQHDLMD